jgi:hypothetical protein
VTVVSLFWTWVLIAAVCAAVWAVARLVGRRVDEAEKERSRRQWHAMCDAIGAEDLTADHALESTTTSSPSPSPSPAPPAPEPAPTAVMR